MKRFLSRHGYWFFPLLAIGVLGLLVTFLALQWSKQPAFTLAEGNIGVISSQKTFFFAHFGQVKPVYKPGTFLTHPDPKQQFGIEIPQLNQLEVTAEVEAAPLRTKALEKVKGWFSSASSEEGEDQQVAKGSYAKVSAVIDIRLEPGSLDKAFTFNDELLRLEPTRKFEKTIRESLENSVKTLRSSGGSAVDVLMAELSGLVEEKEFAVRIVGIDNVEVAWGDDFDSKDTKISLAAIHALTPHQEVNWKDCYGSLLNFFGGGTIVILIVTVVVRLARRSRRNTGGTSSGLVDLLDGLMDRLD